MTPRATNPTTPASTRASSHDAPYGSAADLARKRAATALAELALRGCRVLRLEDGVVAVVDGELARRLGACQ